MNEYQPHECDFCSGNVQPVVADREPIRIGGQIVLIDRATIGKCDRCGHRYFPAAVVKQAEAVANDPDQADRIQTVPVVGV